MSNNLRQRTLIFSSLLLVIVMGFFVFFRSPQSAATISNVILPSATEPIMDFSCDPLPCRMLGQKTNGSGAPLEIKTYNLAVSENKIGGFSEIGFTVQRGDTLIFNFTNVDKPAYYFFIPRLSIGYESSATFPFPWVIQTLGLTPGDYPVMLQDSLDSATAVPNFQAAVLRVE